MEETKGSAPAHEPDISELLGKIEDLEEKLRGYEEREAQFRKAGKKAGRAAAELAVGKEILPASRELFEAVDRNLQNRRLKFPADEGARVVAAVLRRLLRVRAWAIGFALLGLVVATVPPILQWQSNTLLRSSNELLQGQIERQASDTEIVRRTQLIDIIYAEECPEPPLEGCVPRANPRARKEAVLAFLRIERTRGVHLPDLSDSILVEMDFFHADLSGTQLGGANLSGAILFDAYLFDSILVETNLGGADLRGANLDNAFLYDANLSGADLSGADLSGARDLTQEQINNTARGDEYTILPEGLEPPSHWFHEDADESALPDPPESKRE